MAIIFIDYNKKLLICDGVAGDAASFLILTKLIIIRL